MATPQNVELEAAKFLHKLIQESKDEPTKLATKLYVILQHMRSSGKENSMPYQVISRAMETVINQHGLDIEALMSSRVPLTGGTQAGDSATSQFAGSSQRIAVDQKTSLAENEMARNDAYVSSRPPVGPSGAGHDIYQGSVSHMNTKSFDHESPSSFDTRSANSQSQERRGSPNWEKVNEKDSKRASSKRKRAESSLVTESHITNLQPLDSRNPNITNSLSRSSNLKHPEDIEVSSAHNALTLQQGGSLPLTHDVLSSRGLRNQNITGFPFEKSQVSRFSFPTAGGNSSAEIGMHQPSPSSLGSGAVSKIHGVAPGTLGSYAPPEPGNPTPHFSSSYDNHALVAKMHKDRSTETFPATALASTAGKALEHGGGIANTLANANKADQGGFPNNVTEMTMLRSAASRDTGKSPISQGPAVSSMPFKEQHLKQLRAQCLVYLAFRNGLMPKRLHLDIALGNFFPTEDGPCKELIDHKEKEHSINDPSSNPEVKMSFGRLDNARETVRTNLGSPSTGISADANLLKEPENPNTKGEKNGPASGLSEHAEEMRHLLMTRRKVESEMLTQEITKSQTFAIKGSQSDSLNVRGFAVSNHRDDFLNRQGQDGMTDKASSVMVRSQHMKPEGIVWTGNGCYNEASKASLSTSSVLPESVQDREENVPNQCRSLGDYDVQGSRQADGRLSSFPLTEHQKPLSGIDAEHHFVNPVKDANVLAKNVLQVVETNNEEDDIPGPIDILPSPKYTTSEKWIMDQQKRKLLTEQNWALKQQKTQQRITACSDKFKETVSSSEDISAKTRSVIELKKLQLLELQRRLRGDILNDFFKPIAVDMDRLRSIKKHRIGRRSKQLERYEQKMKEERQKRIRERQKEFFSEIEVHKERLEDVFKMRRERWKGFNKFVREFHKRKERVHREKIDRIQREKINLLKINDVEGYLRMVQDAKSDRVKQLLKETEKYLQKLGSKLQDAKVTSRCFETDMDGNQTAGVFEKNEIAIDNEDETDQAKHYLESNEKYYLMAHSIKETVAEQPSCLVRGKLREYQMNGLRWLVSLYNNHLNGILADEMGLGKTVQVISLICYLMETKNDRGPFLVVVPSSVLPGWESEIDFWAPSINKIIYSGPPEERRKLFKERIVHQKFNVLLTTYEYLMNKHDRPKLSKIQWHYVIIDEGHRIKNASCKLNADLKHYRSYHRLLLTGTPLQNNLEELWALLNFLLPNIFNSSEDFSQWFNKPFESNGDNPTDEALLSEEENLLIINRLHQVLRPFVLRRLKHKVENQLPEKIERLVRCEASAYQKLLMKRVEENLGAFGTSKVRSVHNSVMQLRNICNHPYLSQLHAEEVHDFIPKHYLPNIVRLCGKLEMLDRLLPKLKATDHRVLLFSTMTRLLDVMEDYLCWKQYRYLRLDGHTSGGDRGALIDQFNKPGSPFFIFLLSIRAGGVGVNLQAADTVIIFDTDWNPQVDLQAQARAHRIGQKKDVLVLRLETVQTVEEQVRAAAEHKLGVANQSITAGFFDNNTSAEDRREYLESLLRECKKEEAAPVLNDDALNDLIARSESEIDVFESIDKQRQEDEMEIWKKLVLEQGGDGSEPVPPLPARLVKDDDLKLFCEEMRLCEVPKPVVVSSVGLKRKGQNLGGLDTQHYGRGKRAREVRSYEEQWTEDEFEKICQVDSPESPKLKEEIKEQNLAMIATEPIMVSGETEATVPPKQFPQPSVEMPIQQSIEVTPPSKRGRGRPKKTTAEISPSPVVLPATSPSPVVLPATSPSPIVLPATSPSPVVLPAATPTPVVLPAATPTPVVLPATGGAGKMEMGSQQGTVSSSPAAPGPDSIPSSPAVRSISGTVHKFGVWIAPSSQSTPPIPLVSPSSQSTPPLSFVSPGSQSTTTPSPPTSMPGRGRGRKPKSGAEPPRRRGRKKGTVLPSVPDMGSQGGMVPGVQAAPTPASGSGPTTAKYVCKESGQLSHVPVLAASETAEVNMVSERVLVSSSPTAPGSSIAAQSIGVGTAPSSQPTPPSPSVTIGSQSIGVGVAAIPQPAPPLPSIAPGSQTISATTAPNSQPAPTLSSVALGPQSIGAGTAPSSQPTLPSPSVGLGCQSLVMGTAPSSQLTPPLPSVPPGFQPIPPSQPIPKQGRGRGRKAQTGVAAPRRGRKRQDAAITVAPDGSVGRNAIATRSKRQNEAQILMNVVQETSSSVPMDASKSSDKNPANLNVNEVDVSTNSKDGVLCTETEAPKSCSDPATGQTQSADVPPVIKEVPCNTHSLETKVEEPLKSELVPLPASDNTCADVTVTQNLDSKTHSALSNLGTDPIHDLPIDKGESQPVKEVGEIIEMLASNVRDEFVAPKPNVHKPESERTASVSIAPISDAKQFHESLSKDVDSAPTRPMSTATVVDVNEEQSLKEQICSDTVDPVFNLSKDRSENELGTVDVQVQENEDNVLSETLVSEPAANQSLEVKAILTLERETPALKLPVAKPEDEFRKEVASDEAIVSNLDVTVNQSSLETSSSVSSTFVEPPPGFKRPMYIPEGPAKGDVKQQDSKDEPVQADSVVSKPEVTVNSLEYAAAPIVEEDTDEQESKGSVTPNPEVIASSSEANAFSASTYETPMVVEDSGNPVLANSVASNSEVPENSSEEKELSTSTLEENEAIVETAMKQSEDESMKMDIDEQESLEPALVSKPDEVCLEEKTSSDLSVTETAEPLVEPQTEKPENISEENALLTLTLDETAVPIVEPALKESEDQSETAEPLVEPQTENPENNSEENAISTSALEETAAPIVEPAEPLVEPQTEKPENILEENALLTSTLEKTAVPIVEPALNESEDQSETAEPLVEPQTENPENNSEENAISTSVLLETAAPIVEPAEPLVEPQTENPENNSEENAISTSALEETAAPIVEPALKESEDQSEKMETVEQERIDPTLISKPGEVCLEEKTSSSLPVSETAELLVDPPTENPENISEENTISTSALEETATPIVEPDFKEFEDQSEKMETDEQESINPDLVSKLGEVCVEKMLQTENPENISEENTISTSTSTSTLEETAAPIVEPDFKESEDQSEKMETDEQESINPDLVSKPGEVCVEKMLQTENHENISEENTISTSTLEETAAPIVEPDFQESEDQLEKMETDEQESINPDLVSKPGEVCVEEKTSTSLPVSEIAEPLVEPRAENPENEENAISNSTLEGAAASIVEPALKELEDQSEKMETDEHESINPDLVSKPGEVCLEEKTSSSLPVSETAELLVEPQTENPENVSEENTISTSNLEETAVPIVEPDLKDSEDQSAKMDTDEQESIDPALVSKPGEVCLEERTSLSLPVSETAEPFVEPETEKPEIHTEKELEAEGTGIQDFDPNGALLSTQEVCEPDINPNPAAASNEKITDLGKPVEEDSETKINEEEGSSSAPDNTGTEEKENFQCEKPQALDSSLEEPADNDKPVPPQDR